MHTLLLTLLKRSSCVFFLMLFLAGVLNSCASLTKSQLAEVHAFGELTDKFSAYPGKLINTYNHIHVRAELYRANSLVTPAEHYDAILKANDFQKRTDLLTPQIDYSLQIIDAYAQGLVLLTAHTHEQQLDTAAAGLGTNLEALIGQYNAVSTWQKLPTGIGTAIGQLVTLGGGVYIHQKQAEAIQQLIPKGDVVVGNLCDKLLEFLQAPSQNPALAGVGLKDLLENEKVQIKLHYQEYLGLNRELINLHGGKDTAAYKGYILKQRFATLNDDESCLRLLNELDELERLRLQCITAVTNLRKAHARLLEEVQQKRKLTSLVIELQAYANDIALIRKTIKSIQ